MLQFKDFTIKELEKDHFFEIQNPLREKVFEEDHSLFPFQYLSEDEKNKVMDLDRSSSTENYALYLGAFDQKGELVAWHFGFQKDSQNFYMCNSAVLPPFRRKGLYTVLLNHIAELVKEKGFQILYSRHNMTNNYVIIPKLKAGFVISGFEVDDVFGTLVHLKYYVNKTRSKIMDYRVGQLKPDKELKNLLNL